MAVEVAESVADRFGIALLPVFREQHVQRLVYQAHGIERTGMDSTVRVPPRIAHFVDFLGELPDSRHIGKHRCSIRREQYVVKTVFIAGGAGDVKLEGHFVRSHSSTEPFLQGIPQSWGDTKELLRSSRPDYRAEIGLGHRVTVVA